MTTTSTGPAGALAGPILILGAGGFVGANLFLRLRAQRADVYGNLDSAGRRATAWRRRDVPPESIIAANLTDKAAVRALFDEVRPRTVFDCVAYGGYHFEADIGRIYDTNFSALMSLLEAAREYKVAAYVHAGSSSEYGLNAAAPAEDAVLVPNSHYAVSKAAAAALITYYGKVLALPCANLRLYSVYGPLEDTSRLMPALAAAARKGRFPPLVKPETSHDFVFVDDACDAFVLAAANLKPAHYGESFNIGSGRKTTIRELAAIAGRVFDISEPPRFSSMESRRWDVAEWYADASKASRELGWSARTDLEQGLKRMAAWVGSLTEAEFSERSEKRAPKEGHSVSAIVACYKDESAIPLMYQRLSAVFAKLGIDYEIIFVNDCSPEGDEDRIREISARDPRVLGISHSRNFGSQMAFRSGLEMARMDGCVLLDGDLQDPPELIEDFHAKWREGHDVVFGVRVKREMPLAWDVAYKAFYRLFDLFSYIKMPHDAGDFSLMDRRVVEWLLSCPERDLFLRGLRAFVGFKQIGIPYVRPKRAFGHSTNSLFKNLGWAKRGIFSFSNTPLTVITVSGIVLTGVSFCLIATAVLLKVFIPDVAPRGATTLLVAIMLFGSINLLAISFLGEYIGKIFEEVKQRPRFIRAALIRNGEKTEPPKQRPL